MGSIIKSERNLEQLDPLGNRVNSVAHVGVCGVRTYRTATQFLANNTITPLSWDVARHETESSMWAAANPTRLVAPYDGYYAAGGGYKINKTQSAAAGVWFIWVRKNGAGILKQNASYMPSSTSFAIAIHCEMIKLDAGEYVQIVAYHNTGNNENIDACNSGANEFYQNAGWMVRLGTV